MEWDFACSQYLVDIGASQKRHFVFIFFGGPVLKRLGRDDMRRQSSAESGQHPRRPGEGGFTGAGPVLRRAG